jgi:DNA-binding ferritin-like protein
MNIIGPLIQLQQQLRVFHWQTTSFSQHKAFGKTYEALDGQIDEFVETYMGRFGKAKPTVTYSIQLKSLTSDEVVKEVIESYISYFNSMNEELSEASDLLNIRDTMLGELNKLKYLLTLN